MVGLSAEESSSQALTVNAVSSAFDVGTSSSMGELGASGRTVVAETGIGVLRPVGPAKLGCCCCCCSTESEDLRFKPTAREPVYNQKFQKLYKSIYIRKTVWLNCHFIRQFHHVHQWFPNCDSRGHADTSTKKFNVMEVLKKHIISFNKTGSYFVIYWNDTASCKMHWSLPLYNTHYMPDE